MRPSERVQTDQRTAQTAVAMAVPEHTVRPQNQKCFFLNTIHTVYPNHRGDDSPSLVVTPLKCLIGE